MEYNPDKKAVLLCETQPLTAEGLRAILASSSDLEYIGRTETLAGVSEIVRQQAPHLVMIDKSLGIQAVLDWLALAKVVLPPKTQVIIWGVSITEAEALRFLKSGARGILRKTSDPETVLACLHAVADGSSWMADSIFQESNRHERNSRSELTPREQQVLELVEQGMKNKDIARELGIRPGTVKIHLKHIFEKTGVRGRYGLALSVIRQRGGLDQLAKAS
ncbi:MAG: response regulator transcription factor [Acidobacteriaceae bacterium]|jgi:DNA-binding NarL/FixJ family response regulator|nr:response regulator transcription factor [Acidobacteriaceae bacterium]